jgi:hypothetical protein
MHKYVGKFYEEPKRNLIILDAFIPCMHSLDMLDEIGNFLKS